MAALLRWVYKYIRVIERTGNREFYCVALVYVLSCTLDTRSCYNASLTERAEALVLAVALVRA